MPRPNSKSGIKSWSAEDRPREKLLAMGRAALTDAELLAIILGSGSKDLSALGLAKQILADYDHNLTKLSAVSIADLKRYKGVGPAKAVNIMAVLELAKRRNNSSREVLDVITSSQSAYEIIYRHLGELVREEFWIMLLNRGNKVLGMKRISQGGVHGTTVDAKLIFNLVLTEMASGIILAHNHPSGNIKPSQSDIAITERIKAGCKLLDINLMDHLIIGEESYFSFVDEGIL